jgi:hypothetical protein
LSCYEEVLSGVLVYTYACSRIFSKQNRPTNKQLTFKTWVDGETREINGYLVCRIHGADFGNHRNAPTGMITSVAYHDAESKDQMSFLEFISLAMSSLWPI